MPRIYPAQICEIRRAQQAGFTLLETLIALILVVVVATAAIESQVVAIRLEQAARDLRQIRQAVGHVMAQSFLQNDLLASNVLQDADALHEITGMPATEQASAREHRKLWVISRNDRYLELWTHVPSP